MYKALVVVGWVVLFGFAKKQPTLKEEFNLKGKVKEMKSKRRFTLIQGTNDTLYEFTYHYHYYFNKQGNIDSLITENEIEGEVSRYTTLYSYNSANEWVEESISDGLETRITTHTWSGKSYVSMGHPFDSTKTVVETLFNKRNQVEQINEQFIRIQPDGTERAEVDDEVVFLYDKAGLRIGMDRLQKITGERSKTTMKNSNIDSKGNPQDIRIETLDTNTKTMVDYHRSFIYY